MTKDEIKAELRRAAMTQDPWASVIWEAYKKTFKYHESCAVEKCKDVRYFFLFVAEAL